MVFVGDTSVLPTFFFTMPHLIIFKGLQDVPTETYKFLFKNQTIYMEEAFSHH